MFCYPINNLGKLAALEEKRESEAKDYKCQLSTEVKPCRYFYSDIGCNLGRNCKQNTYVPLIKNLLKLKSHKMIGSSNPGEKANQKIEFTGIEH